PVEQRPRDPPGSCASMAAQRSVRMSPRRAPPAISSSERRSACRRRPICSLSSVSALAVVVKVMGAPSVRLKLPRVPARGERAVPDVGGRRLDDVAGRQLEAGAVGAAAFGNFSLFGDFYFSTTTTSNRPAAPTRSEHPLLP